MEALYNIFAIAITIIVAIGVALAFAKAFLGIFYQAKAKVKHPKKAYRKAITPH